MDVEEDERMMKRTAVVALFSEGKERKIHRKAERISSIRGTIRLAPVILFVIQPFMLLKSEEKASRRCATTRQ